MQLRFVLAVLVTALSGLILESGAAGGEPLGRGTIARPLEGGKVYVGWRLLASDPADAAFDVYRHSGGGEPVKVNREPVTRTTDFVDESVPDALRHGWFVRLAGEKDAPAEHVRIGSVEKPLPYIGVKLEGDYTFQKVGIADLDGDGRLDIVIKQPGDNIDPYDKYWKPSPDTYKLEAWTLDGKMMLWRYDLGWAIERGIWYSPYLVYDLDGDGRAEVAVKTGEGDPRDADGRVKSGPEYLTILDGRTGKPITRIDWPTREGFGGPDGGYNRSCRNQLTVAHLDGERPSLIANRGTYDLIRFVAYRFDGKKLSEQWKWDNSALGKEWQGQGAHWTHTADVDGDGRDEIVVGSCVLDDNGKELWTTGLGHPDHCYVGDIDPTRPGLEIYYGIEARRQTGNGMCLADAKTGEILWGIKEPTKHVHGQGMCADLDAAHPGSECYSAESDPSKGKSLAWAMLHSAKGELLSQEVIGGFAPYAALWDADAQRELVVDGRITNYGSKEPLARIEGKVIAVADILGDWREEIITSVPGEMRIYVSTVPAKERRTCLLEDRLYRTDVAAAAMGYYQPPMLSYDLATGK